MGGQPYITMSTREAVSLREPTLNLRDRDGRESSVKRSRAERSRVEGVIRICSLKPRGKVKSNKGLREETRCKREYWVWEKWRDYIT